MSLENIRANNKITVKPVTDPAFSRFGRIVDEIDCSDLCKRLRENSPLPNDTIYVASADALENGPEKAAFERLIFGGMEIQMGYCNGGNSMLNALEYHKGNEVNIACDDVVLLVACLTDVSGGRLAGDAIEAFFVEAGQAVELYATTLHYAPCKAAEAGFRVAILLPKGTNLPLPEGFSLPAADEARLLTAVNKWLYAHDDNCALRDAGAVCGIGGENIEIKL